MLGNDVYGTCVPVTWANERRIITFQNGHEYYPNMDQVAALYKTQNPAFPEEDNGMNIQECLGHLVRVGGPDGVKALAFAKVNFINEAEIDAAIAIFGAMWVGINVLKANSQQFDNRQPWDYVAGSPFSGGHSVVAGDYKGVTSGGDIQFITWAEQTSFTDRYRTQLWDEAWVVIWPEHWTMEPFLQGVDSQKLALAYQELTGRILVPPAGPTPAPEPPYPEPAPGCMAGVMKKVRRFLRR
jgi:hypothetical protein